MPWVLKDLSTDEIIEGPERLPENWGPIFGLHGVKDKLHDLSWVGLDGYGWFELSPDVEYVPPEPIEKSPEEEARDTRDKLLKDSDWAVMPDVPLSVDDYNAWIEYRRQLRDVTLQPGFPLEINWPLLPGSH